MKRVLLFLATNFAVMMVLSVAMSLLGVDARSSSGLLMMALIFGMGGSFISLLISKRTAKWSTGAKVIETPSNDTERWLVDTVAMLADKAQIAMPEVAIYSSPVMNAFATGSSRNNALVAVSSGLLRSMTRDEAKAVLGHEVTHVTNGDMVTLTLIQGVVNTFVIFLARMIAGMISGALSQNNKGGQGLGLFAYMGIVFVLEMCLGILASLIVAWFSRQREYKADAGGANLAGRQHMIDALKRLGGTVKSDLNSEMVAFGINGGQTFAQLLMSHPPLERRIAALQLPDS